MPLGKIQLQIVSKLVEMGRLSAENRSALAVRTDDLSGDSLDTWLLTPDGTLALQSPVGITELELNRMVRTARHAFGAEDARSALLDPDELSTFADSTDLAGRNADDDWRKLADLLLPVDLTRKVPAGTPIVIVPHGSIGLVPFSALATDRMAAVAPDAAARTVVSTSTTLGMRNPLRYAPSFAALRASERRARTVAVRPTPKPSAPQQGERNLRRTSPLPRV